MEHDKKDVGLDICYFYQNQTLSHGIFTNNWEAIEQTQMFKN